MDDVSNSRKTGLGSFIRSNLELILVEWEQFARNILCGQSMNTAELRDHAMGMLETIADDLETSQTPLEQSEKAKGRGPRKTLESEAERHGVERSASGFTATETISEFRALRASVLQLCSRDSSYRDAVSNDQIIRFNEAVDQALTESLECYILEQDALARRFDTLLSASPDLHFIIDVNGAVLYANLALSRLFDRSSKELIGTNLSDLCPKLDAQLRGDIRRATMSGQPQRGELTCHADPQAPRAYRYVFIPVIKEGGITESVTGSARNISELKASEAQILRNAYYDSLTGLPNRLLFRDRLGHEIKHAARTDRQLALFYIDLDQFKEVNDRYGHAEGDILLRDAAHRIASCVRASDTVARLGGDEFIVIVTDVGKLLHVEALAEEILCRLTSPFHIQEKEVHVSGSIGITLYPADAFQADDLVRNADQAMFVAKKNGRNRYSFFTSEMRESASTRLRVIDELRSALVGRQLIVHYQPIVELATGTILKAEALVRWRHPQSGLIAPTDFIGLAEETGMIGEIGNFVLNEVIAKAGEWSAIRGVPFQISVNKSPVEFMDRCKIQSTNSDLTLLKAAGKQITLEITEGVMLNDTPSVREKLLALKEAGVQIAIDDFGTGYSSMASLKKFKVDFLKIDQSFVNDMMTNLESRIFAETIVVMAHKLGLKVIAEGIETHAQRDCLKAVGCDYGQGFLFSEPVDAREFETLLRSS